MDGPAPGLPVPQVQCARALYQGLSPEQRHSAQCVCLHGCVFQHHTPRLGLTPTGPLPPPLPQTMSAKSATHQGTSSSTAHSARCRRCPTCATGACCPISYPPSPLFRADFYPSRPPSCGVPGHLIKDCPQNKGASPPPGYLCHKVGLTFQPTIPSSLSIHHHPPHPSPHPTPAL